MPISLVRPSLLRFNGNSVTGHNRSPLAISNEPFEKFVRTWDGTGRLQHIATKRKFNCSWEMLPGPTANTVDGFWGADDIAVFYANNKTFTLTIVKRDGTLDTVLVKWSDFSIDLEKRWQNANYYNLNVGFEEL